MSKSKLNPIDTDIRLCKDGGLVITRARIADKKVVGRVKLPPVVVGALRRFLTSMRRRGAVW